MSAPGRHSSPQDRGRPTHVGLIPDGARRWARANDRTLDEAYRVTFELLARFTDRIFTRGSQSVSLYLLSKRNLKRAPAELEIIVTEEARFCRAIAPIAERHRAAVHVAGERTLQPERLVGALDELVAATKDNDSARLYLCVGYDPMDELAHALGSPDPGDIFERMWVPEEIDLVIRTSGVTTLSEFLPLQSAYAQLHFLPTLFNDMKEEDIDEVLDDFAAKDLRRGL